MAKKEKPATKLCRHCKTEIPYEAKICPNCQKKTTGGKIKWIIIAVLIIIIIIIAAVSLSNRNSDDTNITKVGTVGDDGTVAESIAEEEDDEEVIQTEYHVGDILMDGNMQIVYMASGVYQVKNEYSQPDEGYQYIFLQFAFENTSETSDSSISYFSFDAYADGYSADMYYGGEDALSATLSAGRSTTGFIYFIVPKDAEEIEVEYTTNYLTEEKITFMYDGETNCGYEPPLNTERTAGAFSVGEVAEVEDLAISYLSCEADESNNIFITPADGYHYITLTFEFENNGEVDEYVSYYDFDCYADGRYCGQVYFRDDGLSNTISSGHKARGTVTFEVPDDATVIEAEFLSDYWTSSRIVFSCEG